MSQKNLQTQSETFSKKRTIASFSHLLEKFCFASEVLTPLMLFKHTRCFSKKSYRESYHFEFRRLFHHQRIVNAPYYTTGTQISKYRKQHLPPLSEKTSKWNFQSVPCLKNQTHWDKWTITRTAKLIKVTQLVVQSAVWQRWWRRLCRRKHLSFSLPYVMTRVCYQLQKTFLSDEVCLQSSIHLCHFQIWLGSLIAYLRRNNVSLLFSLKGGRPCHCVVFKMAASLIEFLTHLKTFFLIVSLLFRISEHLDQLTSIYNFKWRR